MTHQEIDAGNYVDSYLRGELDEKTRAAFEEHYFECEQCLAALQEAERLRDAVAVGVSRGWFREPGRVVRWAWLSVAAVMLLSAGLVWAVLYRIPQLQSALADARRQPSPAATVASVEAPASPAVAPELNLPWLALRAERAAGDAPTVMLPRAREKFVLTLDAPIGANAASFQFSPADGGAAFTVPGLVANASGAFVVSLPTARFPTGAYRLRVTDPAGRALGEFLFRVETR